MPDLAQMHPQVVHFVVALFIVGVLARLVAFTGKVAFADKMATTLIVLAAIASVVAVESGHRAHGAVERIPGTRAAVNEHEEWGERTRDVFLGVAALELLGLAMAWKKWPYRKYVVVAATVAGVAGIGVLYETAEHGGTLVYSYAGGVGTRSGEPQDVGRLLVAGLYNEGMLARREGRSEEAARLFEELSRQRPDDPDVELLAAQSLLLDREDGAGAIAALHGIDAPAENRFFRYRHDLLLADAYEAAGYPDSARATLEALSAAFPDNQRIMQRLEQLK